MSTNAQGRPLVRLGRRTHGPTHSAVGRAAEPANVAVSLPHRVLDRAWAAQDYMPEG